MHIAFFTNFYLPVVNGVVRSVESFREELTREGNNVFVFTHNFPDHEDQAPFIFHFPSLVLPMEVNIPAVIPVSSFVDQLLPSLKLDVVHTHHPILLGQTAARKAHELNLPLVFTFHTRYQEYTHYIPVPQDVFQEFLKDTVQTWLVDYMQQCQHIVIPSESMKDLLVRDYGLRNRYTVIPTGINLEPYQSVDGKTFRARLGWNTDQVLISTGRLAEEKNLPVLLEAAKKVHKKYPNLRVVLIGDGPQRRKLEELVSELGFADRVTFVGQVPFSDVTAYLKAADLFGFSSVTETQGLVTMEAMAAGLPVVAVDGSGTRDIVDDGEQGYLVQNEPDALAESMIRVLGSNELMHKFKENAIKKAKTFDLKSCTKQLMDVYEQAIMDKADGQFVTIEGETGG